VLKSGGEYDAEYVRRLYDSVQRHIAWPHQFACLTDSENVILTCPNFQQLPLLHSLPAWWSKIELFRLQGAVLTFDLDLVPVADCTRFASLASELGQHEFATLRGLRQEPWCSSVMAWNGDYSTMLTWFLEDYGSAERREDKKGYHLIINGVFFHGDQEWIMPMLKRQGVYLKPMQDGISGIYSFKDGIRDKPFPEDTRLVCFHGRPRPHTLIPTPAWMQNEGWNNES
jgi:hypothetical protein